jgi:hypothetical protein
MNYFIFVTIGEGINLLRNKLKRLTTYYLLLITYYPLPIQAIDGYYPIEG